VKLVCEKCRTQLRVKRNGVLVVDMFQTPPEPYEIREGDLWECPGCNARIVAGFGLNPVASHYDSDAMRRWILLARAQGLYIENHERAQK